MDEAAYKFYCQYFRGAVRSIRVRITSIHSKEKEAGQAIIEFLLVLIVALAFTRLVYFHKEFGFKGLLDKTMLKLGGYLEQNLKTGTGNSGGDGENSLDPYAGTGQWKN